jgi:hypothetical protein
VASFLVFVVTAGDDHVLHRPASGYLLGFVVVYRLVVYLRVARDILRTETTTDEPVTSTDRHGEETETAYDPT